MLVYVAASYAKVYISITLYYRVAQGGGGLSPLSHLLGTRLYNIQSTCAQIIHVHKLPILYLITT